MVKTRDNGRSGPRRNGAANESEKAGENQNIQRNKVNRGGSWRPMSQVGHPGARGVTRTSKKFHWKTHTHPLVLQKSTASMALAFVSFFFLMCCLLVPSYLWLTTRESTIIQLTWWTRRAGCAVNQSTRQSRRMASRITPLWIAQPSIQFHSHQRVSPARLPYPRPSLAFSDRVGPDSHRLAAIFFSFSSAFVSALCSFLLALSAWRFRFYRVHLFTGRNFQTNMSVQWIKTIQCQSVNRRQRSSKEYAKKTCSQQ